MRLHSRSVRLPFLMFLAVIVAAFTVGFASAAMADIGFLSSPIGQPPVLVGRPLTTMPPVPPPTPRPAVSHTPRTRPASVAVKGTSNGPSTNRYVQPWGCEARHAQQWNPSRKYWGKYQFDRQTWAAHGGNPAEYGSAPESEQDRVASAVKYDAWPNC